MNTKGGLAMKLIKEMTSLYDAEQSKRLSRFFKTGEGEYGEGDCFLGIKVPVTRNFVKRYKNEITLNEINYLITSEWHEIRLAGFLLLFELYKKAIKEKKEDEEKEVIEFYLENLGRSNNWDLVDLVADKLLGEWTYRNQDKVYILYDLADKDGYLWHQRVAIVSTFAFIKNQSFDVTFRIVKKFLKHPHDLIHKAAGWMLREIGKRGGKEQLVNFLNKNKREMPRTMLRYAIEKFSKEERQEFLVK